jgi:GT2 family glycosyltransferase
MAELALLIVSWNVRDLLDRCLQSVYADLEGTGSTAHIWVVDNDSRDGSADMVANTYPQVRLIRSGTNRGFAAGNNLALRQMAQQASPQYVLLLNPDTEVQPGALEALRQFMGRRPTSGVAGARLFYGDGTFQHAAFGFPGLWQILFDLFGLPARLYDTRLNGRYPRSWYERGEPFKVDHPLGAAMMVRWETLEQVGLLDEGYHMYCEEIDWCMRIKAAGWGVFCVPQARVTHYEGQSTQQIRADSFVNLWRSRRRLYDKHYGPVKRLLAYQLVRVGMRRRITQAQRESADYPDDAEVLSRIQALRGALACFEKRDEDEAFTSSSV